MNNKKTENKIIWLVYLPQYKKLLSFKKWEDLKDARDYWIRQDVMMWFEIYEMNTESLKIERLS